MSAFNKDADMERSDLGHSSKSEPGGRCLSGPEVKARAGIAVPKAVSGLLQFEGKEAVADRG